MKLVALDLETTGLNPQTDQILEIGMVCFESTTGEVIGEYETLVAHPRYEGEAFALQMNAGLLKRLANANAENAIWFTDLPTMVRNALAKWDFNSANKPIAVGFNVAPFDLAFLKTAEIRLFHHRAVEVGTLLMGQFGEDSPVTSAEFQQHRSGAEVAHTALADCHMALDAYMVGTGRDGIVTSA